MPGKLDALLSDNVMVLVILALADAGKVFVVNVVGIVVIGADVCDPILICNILKSFLPNALTNGPPVKFSPPGIKLLNVELYAFKSMLVV